MIEVEVEQGSIEWLKMRLGKVTGTRLKNVFKTDNLTLIDEFCRKNDVLVILAAHPNKLEKGANGKRVVPDFYDVKGGGEFYDMSYHGLCVYRDWDLEYLMVKVLKVKFAHLGDNNAEIWFKYNINNGRLSELTGHPNDPTLPDIIWDNSNWVTNGINKNNQKEIEINDDLNEIDPEFDWTNQESREIPPF